MKRALFLLMALIMVFTCTACGGKTTTTTTTSDYYVEGGESNGENTGNNSEGGDETSSDKVTSVELGEGNTAGNIKNPLSANLKGATITIYQVTDNFTPNAKTSKADAARVNLIAKLKKELNCKINVKTTTVANLRSSVTSSAASGKALSHLVETSMYSSGYYIVSGLMTDLSKVSSVDFSKDYMNRLGIAEASKFGKGTYAVPTEGWERISVVLYNKRILKEMGYADSYLYDLVKNGKWTLAAYNDLSKKAVKDLDGKPGLSNDDQYGHTMIGAESGMTTTLIANAGTSMIKRDASGKLVYNMEDTKILSTLTEFYGILTNGGHYVGVDADKSRTSFFNNGKCLFMWAPRTNMTSLTKMKDEYGLLPSPKLTESSKYVSAIDWNCPVMMMPAGLTAKEQAYAGAFIQAYEYLLSDIISADSKEVENRYLHDDESADNLTTIVNNATVNPDQFFGQISETIQTGTYRVMWDYLNLNKNTPMASAIESSKSATVKALEEINAKIK